MPPSPSASPRFDVERADRVQAIFEKLLRHTKGRYARAQFILAPWQRDQILRPLFGTVRWDEQLGDWVRQYRIAWLELARGNGKSELLAGIGLVLLAGDSEQGAEIYGCASDREQAGHVFRVAKRMVELSPTLSKRLTVVDSRKMIIDSTTDSVYKVIAADAGGNLGATPHGILFDEVISQPNRELWDALKTGLGKRSQPLMVAATTAGNDPSSFAAAEHLYCEQVAADPARDPSRFVYMRNTPKEADWKDEKVWAFANPGLGDFVSIQALRDQCREAVNNPSAENSFRQYHLNQWVQQHSRWINIDVWDASAGLVMEDQLRGRRCFGGLDLASSVDIAALAWDFPDDDGSHDVLWRFWIPEERLTDLDSRTGGQASVWVREGFLSTTEGNVIDFSAILARIDRDARAFDVAEIGYDRWGATQLVQDLGDAGMVVVPVGQGFASMSAPTKELERLVLSKRYHHGGNPLARWMVNNVAIRTDPAGNIKPDKAKSGEKIDGIVAGIMALDRATRHEPVRQQFIPRRIR